jgi:HK97 gp10 family phage protein
VSEIDVTELNRLAGDFDRADRTAGRRASAVVRKTAYDVVATAQTFVPVDTGATKGSIYASALTGGPLGPESLAAEVGPTTEYAPHLEFGTAKMAPYAFMGPAMDRHGPAFVDGLAQVAGDLE